MNKYEKLKDQISDIINSFGFDHKIYNSDGKSTNDIYEARYIFCNKPNFMIIVRNEENEVEFHKGKMEFDVFHELINKLRLVTKAVFVRLHVMAINQYISPKKYSKDVLRNKRLDSIVTEQYNPSQSITEIRYQNDNILIVKENLVVDISGFDDIMARQLTKMAIHEGMNLSRFKTMVGLINANQLIETIGSSLPDTHILKLNEHFLKLREL